MLHAHPRLAMPPETRFLIPVYRGRAEFGDLRVEDNRRRLAHRITEPMDSMFADLALDRTTVMDRIVESPPTVGSAAGTVWREFARDRGKARWGEKRPAYWRDLDVVLRLFPDAQIVHLMRDGRACVASLKQVNWWREGVLGAMATWVLAERQLRKAGRRLPPDSYYRLRYEDLLADPEHELTRLCEFLGEDFDDAMLDRGDAARDIVKTRQRWHDRVKGELDPARIEAWRTVLEPEELGLFETVAGRGLRRNGYELSGAGERPTLSGLAAYYEVLGRRIGSMIKWRLRDAKQRRTEQVPLADLG